MRDLGPGEPSRPTTSFSLRVRRTRSQPDGRERLDCRQVQDRRYRAELTCQGRPGLATSAPAGRAQAERRDQGGVPIKAVTVVDPIDDVLSGHVQRLRCARSSGGRSRNWASISSLVAGLRRNPAPHRAWPPPSPPSPHSGTRSPRTSGSAATALCRTRDTRRRVGAGPPCQRPPGGDFGLRLAGQPSVFAIGDLTAIPEAKRGGAAGRHAEVVARNIRSLIEHSDELVAYQPAPVILLPLGPTGGVSQLPGQEDFAGPEMTAQIKGQDMFVGRYAEMFNLSK